MYVSALLSILLTAVAGAPSDGLYLDKTRVAMRSTTGIVPFKFPLPNGFPNVTSTATLKEIEYQAGGPLPNSPSPATSSAPLSTTAARALQAVAFNELMEVAFFTQLLHNITNSVPGYELGDDRAEIIAAVNSSQAQEQLHLLNANSGLKTSNFKEIEPCEYHFPVSTFTEAMNTADDFSGLLVGLIAPLLEAFKAGGDLSDTVINLFCAVLGQEGQQDGYFRHYLSKVPNANGWLTTSSLEFVFSHIHQSYVVHDTCPKQFNLTIFETLTPLSAPPTQNSTISFSTTQTGVTTSNHIAYLSGPHTPVVVPISDIIRGQNGLTTFKAPFPYEVGFSRGLTIAALVHGADTFDSAAEVSDATLAGPGLIQVNYN